MKAIVYRSYGPPGVLQFDDIEKPVPATNEVLIRVRAASVNPLDWHFMRGTPLPLRLLTGLSRPKSPRLGRDLAGHVEAIGNAVTQFKPGDAVYGTGHGAFAEFACAQESELAHKPQSLTFLQAAAVPIAGITALQALRDKARVSPGQNVLINGAAGGVGTFAVQIANCMRAGITAVCSARNIGLVRALGADHVIDYAREDFTRGAERYHAILECVGNHPFSHCRRVLLPGGIYVAVGGGGPDQSTTAILGGAVGNLAFSLFSRRKMAGILAKMNTADLNLLSEFITAGKLTPVIDLEFQLAEVPDAIRYLEVGHARGKVVIVI